MRFAVTAPLALCVVAVLTGSARAQDQAPSDASVVTPPEMADPAPLTPTITPTTTTTTTSTSEVTVSTAFKARPSRPPGIERNAWYIGVGLGVGASGASDNSFGGTPLAGMTNLRAGAIIADRILVGGQVTLTGQFYKWAASQPTGAVVSSALAEGMYFPFADLPLNVAGGLGWGSAFKVARLADTARGKPNVTTAAGNGPAWMAGVGWDFFAGTGFNLGLQARYEGNTSGHIAATHIGSLNLWFNFY